MLSFFFRAFSFNPFLTAVAILPAIFLMVKIYRADPLGRQPKSFLAIMVWMGALSTTIAVILEWIGGLILLRSVSDELIYNILLYFLVVGLAEEGAKYFVLKRSSWNSENFNCRFDGVVYAAFVSLGFALTENVGYALRYGMGTALLRAVTAVPCHASCGIFMGAFYGAAKHYEYYNTEQSRRYRILSLVVPTLLHGAYDFIASREKGLSPLFLLFVAILFFAAYKIIQDLSWRGEDFYERWSAPEEKRPGGFLYMVIGLAAAIVALVIIIKPSGSNLFPKPSSPTQAVSPTRPSQRQTTAAPGGDTTSASAASASTSAASASLPSSVKEKKSLAQTAFDLMNHARRSKGLETLSWDEDLYQCALIRAEEITRKFDTTRPDGRAVDTILEDHPVPGIMQLSGENIASGYRNASAVHDAFMDSDGHRENILYSAAAFAAVACVQKDGILYWVQIIGE